MFKKMSAMFIVLAFIGITGSFATAKDITTKNKQPTNFTTIEVNVPHIDKRNLKVWDNAWEIYQILYSQINHDPFLVSFLILISFSLLLSLLTLGTSVIPAR